MYIQIVHLFEDGNSINTEIEKFKDFKALGKKYILSLDTANYTRNGVIHRNIIDFLNDKDIEISGIRFYQ